jgi:hypothetical protein
MKPVFYSVDTLRNAGFQSPADTLQTVFYAIKQKDLEGFARCFSGDLLQTNKDSAGEALQSATADIRNGFTGFEIEAIKGPSSGRCVLTVSLMRDGGDPKPDDILFTNTPDGWKVSAGP